MIENLNEISFKNYGTVIHEGFEYACNLFKPSTVTIREHKITDKQVQEVVFFKKSKVIIDIVEGIALLCLCTDPASEKLQTFLLDKTIIVNPNIYYKVIPLYGSCTIKVAIEGNSQAVNYLLNKPYTPLGIYPKVDINQVHTLFYQEKEKGFWFKGEKHDFWELTYVDQGYMTTYIDGKKFILHQGDCIFYGKGQYHVQEADKKTAVCFITITFDMDLKESEHLINQIFTIDAEMKNLLEKILEEKENNSYYAEDLILCYLKEFIIKIIRNEKLETTIHTFDSSMKQKVENSIVNKALEYIYKNISSQITVSDVAQSIPISQSYLSTLFKKHTNMTLIDYVNHYRLEQSKDMIRNTDYNFTKIADLLGYSSVHYFSRQFKAKYGISPSTYAKAIRK